jgi:hypothetical protein
MFQECRHIKTNGSKCHAAALKGKPYCYYHVRLHGIMRRSAAPIAPYEQRELEMPFLEDRGAVQIALSEIVGAIAGRRIDHKSAALIVYALQVASSNAKDMKDLVADEQVRDRFETREGEDLAPEVTTLEPGDVGYRDEYGEPTLAEVILGPGWKERYEAVAREKRMRLQELQSDDGEPDPDSVDPEDPDRPLPWRPGM